MAQQTCLVIQADQNSCPNKGYHSVHQRKFKIEIHFCPLVLPFESVYITNLNRSKYH